MASNATKNYGLCQWVRTDKVLMDDFNADNAKIDTALAGKASVSALSSLQSTVNSLSASKADQTALDSLKTTVGQHTSTLNGKGNCQIYTGTYSGTGIYGKDSQNSLTFPGVPEFVFISASGGMQGVLIQGQEFSYSSNGGSGSPLALTWSGKSVQWYNHMSATGQLNAANTTYLVVALIKAG